MGYGRQYARHALFTVSATIASGILFYTLRIVLYARLTTDDYGLFYVIMSMARMVHPFLTFGMDPGVVPFITRYREKGDFKVIKSLVMGALASQGLLALVGMVLICLFAGPIASRWFGAPHAAGAVRIVAVQGGFNVAFTTGMAFLLGMQAMGARSLSDLARVVACLSGALLLLHAGWGLEAAAGAYVMGSASGAACVFAAAFLLHKRVFTAPFQWRPDLLKAVFNSGKYLTIAYGGVMIFSQMDTVMIGFLLPGFGAAAAYQLAVPTVTILYSLLLALGVSFMPMVTTLIHRDEQERLEGGINRFFEAAAVVLLPATVIMACFSDVLMRVLFRRDILNAPDAFNVLAVGSVFYFFCYFTLQILAGMGRTRHACIAIVTSLGLNLILNIVLILLFGIRGAAAATVLSHVAATILGLSFVRRELAVAFRWRTLLAVPAVSVALGFLGAAIRGTESFEQHPAVVAAITGVLMYGAALSLLEMSGCARLRELARVTIVRT